jgi:X-X-X-Leu-X-X-Gly heptad repeat protein
MNKVTQRFALGTIFAAGAGYIAGILTAPKSGRETRDDIANAAKKSALETEKQLKHVLSELNDGLTQVQDKAGNLNDRAHKEADRLIGQAKETKGRVRELISGIHEGEPEDKELKRALSDAKKAVAHLRNFLKG